MKIRRIIHDPITGRNIVPPGTIPSNSIFIFSEEADFEVTHLTLDVTYKNRNTEEVSVIRRTYNEGELNNYVKVYHKNTKFLKLDDKGNEVPGEFWDLPMNIVSLNTDTTIFQENIWWTEVKILSVIGRTSSLKEQINVTTVIGEYVEFVPTWSGAVIYKGLSCNRSASPTSKAIREENYLEVSTSDIESIKEFKRIEIIASLSTIRGEIPSRPAFGFGGLLNKSTKELMDIEILDILRNNLGLLVTKFNSKQEGRNYSVDFVVSTPEGIELDMSYNYTYGG